MPPARLVEQMLDWQDWYSGRGNPQALVRLLLEMKEKETEAGVSLRPICSCRFKNRSSLQRKGLTGNMVVVAQTKNFNKYLEHLLI